MNIFSPERENLKEDRVAFWRLDEGAGSKFLEDSDRKASFTWGSTAEEEANVVWDTLNDTLDIDLSTRVIVDQEFEGNNYSIIYITYHA